MQNLTLNNNVKKYFVNALKGLGLGDENTGKELTTAQITQLFNDPNTTPYVIYRSLRQAILVRIQNDAVSAQYLKNKTAFDRQTTKLILNELSVNSQYQQDIQNNADVLLRDLSASGIQENGISSNTNNRTVTYRGHLDEITEEVISTIIKGILDQDLNRDDDNVLNDEEVNAGKLWYDILYSHFREYLIKNYSQFDENRFKQWVTIKYRNEDENAPQQANDSEYDRLYQKFHVNRVENDVLHDVATRCFGGNTRAANQFLDTKIETNMREQVLAANGVLLDECLSFCKKRCRADGLQPTSFEDELKLRDVLAAAGNAKPQIVTFFQTRSKEQQENPVTTEVTAENKIGNLMGEKGREYVKKSTGTKPAVVFDTQKDWSKKGKKGPWRGLKELYERICRFMLSEEQYKNMQSIGFVTLLLEQDQKYTSGQNVQTKHESQQSHESIGEPWKVNFQPMSSAYKNEDGSLNAAGEFCSKTRARVLADKVRMHELNAKITDGCSQDEQKKYAAQIAYLQQRIANGENALATLAQQIATMPDAQNLKDPKYFAKLTEQIITPKKEEKPQNKQEDLLQNMANDIHAIKESLAGEEQNEAAESEKEEQDTLAEEAVQELVDNDQYYSANDEMAHALLVLNETVQGTSFGQQKAKVEMAADVLNLRQQYKAGQITGQALVDMAQRFTKSDVFRNVFYGSYINTLKTDDAFKNISQFKENDLKQHAFSAQYNQYVAEQNQARIQTAVTDEMTR
ncbi:MAG: hypothetical protein MJ060_00180 [Clostridia bacterium]|nr:hypothetical protein [Clostridia bacterium]